MAGVTHNPNWSLTSNYSRGCRCEPCLEAGRARYQGQKVELNAKRAIANRLKQLIGCVDCGYNAHATALQWDHVRGDKLFNPSLITQTWPRLLAEFDKCEVRCANCHSIRTHND